MGVFGALSTAITGLSAQSFALEQISGNIANAQTTAYKRTDTRFVDLIPDAPPTQQKAGGVSAWAQSTNDVQGDIKRSDSPTSMAINGDGYFIVERSGGYVDNKPIFTGASYYTRRGDFDVDRNGYLVNGAGYYLKGLSVDPRTNNVVGSVPQVVRITNDLLPAKQTTQITYHANLPAYPLTSTAKPSVAGSELLGPAATYTAGFDPRSTAAGGTGQVIANDTTTFLDHSIAGGAITAYDASGNPVDVQLRWAKVDSVANGGTDTWNLFYLTNANATGTAVAWQNANVEYTFNASGQLTSPATGTITLAPLTVNGTSIASVTLDSANNGLTQFADPNGATKVTDLKQDGYTVGEPTGITVTERGRIRVSYSNSQAQDIAEIELASFHADNMLKKLDGGAFAETQDSGAPILGANGRILGGSLEGSNTDIADEFTKLIVTQQAYSANTRVITTSQEMMKDALNMLR